MAYVLRPVWPETQAPPPQTAGINLHLSDPHAPLHQHYTVSLPHKPQRLSHSPYVAIPVLSHSHYNYIPIQSPPAGNHPYTLHGGYTWSEFPYDDAGTSAMEVGVAVHGVHGYGREDSTTTSAIRQYGAHMAPPNCFLTGALPYQNTLKQPSFENTGKNVSKKNSKVAQSAYCGVCNLDCNSQDVLKSHKLGKKHKKNLLKLQDSITPAPASSTEIATHDGEKKSDEKKRKTALPENKSEIETKKTRVLEAGASADEVRVCNICNVVTNSRRVFDDHIAGQKHAAMEKKLHKAAVG